MEILLIFSSILNAIFGFLVFLKNRKNILNKIFFIFALSISGWIFSIFLIISVSRNVFIGELPFVFASFIVASLLAFSMAFFKNFIKKYWLIIIYFPTIIFSILSFSGFIISSVSVFESNYITNVFGPAYKFYTGFIVIYVLLAVVILIKNFIKSYGIKRLQNKFLFLGISLFIIPAVLTNLILPTFFNIWQFNIIGPVFSVFMIGFIAYAITRYHLMDIMVVIQRGLAFSILFLSLVLLCSIGCIYLLSFLPMFWATFISSAIIVLAFMPLKNFLEKITDKIFLRKQYKFDSALSDLFFIASNTIEINSLISNVENKLIEILKTNKAKILVFGINDPLEKIYLSSHLKKHQNEILDSGVFDLFLDHGAKHYQEEFNKVRDDFKKIDFQIAAPIVFNKKIGGILFLGSKIEGAPFYFKDINFIKASTTYLAAAIENAKLFKETNNLVGELTVANKAKSDFITVTSHQFRTPLSTIRWYSENIISDLSNGESDNSKFIESIKIINERAVFLINVLNLIFRALEIDAKNLKIQKEKIFLWEIISEIIRELEIMAHGKKIDIIFEKERVFLGEVSADSEKIKDALRILIANSITYSDSGSKVFVTIEEIEKDGGKYCRICVKDAGIGIDKNDQGLLFDKFFRAKNAVLFAPDGTGLGLYIAKYIVENHDGLIWVESELGKGSEFYIDLPI